MVMVMLLLLVMGRVRFLEERRSLLLGRRNPRRSHRRAVLKMAVPGGFLGPCTLIIMGMKRPRRVMLSEDILEHAVLPWLPAKSLIRFKCVSRRWCDLMSKKFFILQQYRLCTAPSSLIYQGWYLFDSFYTGLCSAGIPDFHMHFKGWVVSIIASCNGLIVLSCRRPIMPRIYELYVGNPVLQDWKKIPMPGKHLIFWIGLAFDPVDSVGYYELVCPYLSYGDSPNSNAVGFMVLSSMTGEWKESMSIIDIPPNTYWVTGYAVFLCGKFYWPFGVNVLWFDTKRDCSGMIPSPIRDCDIKFCCLDRSKHGLTYTRFCDYEVDIWAMKEQQWLKLYHVQIEDIVLGNPDMFASLCNGMDVRNRKPFDIIASKYNAGLMSFGGKVIFFAIGDAGFGYDVESEETTRFPGCVSWSRSDFTSVSRHLPMGCRWSPFKGNLIPLPGHS